MERQYKIRKEKDLSSRRVPFKVYMPVCYCVLLGIFRKLTVAPQRKKVLRVKFGQYGANRLSPAFLTVFGMLSVYC
jgi:hypothetical protein